MEEKYSYFVSYNFKNKIESGTGSLNFLTDKKIENYKDIMDMVDVIKEFHGFKVVIINNYILLDN